MVLFGFGWHQVEGLLLNAAAADDAERAADPKLGGIGESYDVLQQQVLFLQWWLVTGQPAEVADVGIQQPVRNPASGAAGGG